MPLTTTLSHTPLSLTQRMWVPPPSSYDDLLCTLLQQRGFASLEEAADFLSPSLQQLPNPSSMAHMDTAAELVAHHIRTQGSIVVYGDYDVDGVCSTAWMVEFLRAVGARVDFYIPDRRAEGYGLNADAIVQLAERHNLIITVDCGIGSHHEIALARKAGAQVVVVDHHQVPPSLPEANACLNPHRPDCTFPFKPLCAAGVAFMLTIAIRRTLRTQGFFAHTPEPDLRTGLDLVALATVADMVPLTSLNRLLVHQGLQRMRMNKRIGLQALMKVAGVQSAHIQAQDIGFRLAPRINARGRLEQASMAVDLLLSQNPAEAEAWAHTLDQNNTSRRTLETHTSAEACALVEQEQLHQHAALVVGNPSWHAGVLGLVANTLVKRFALPTLVLGEQGKGSGRSVEGLHLLEALHPCADLLLKYGGHKAALGVTMDFKHIPALRERLSAQVLQRLGPGPYLSPLKPDIAIPHENLSPAVLRTLQQLEPFGQGNPEPLFYSPKILLKHARVVGEKHLKMSCASGLEAIAFGLGNLLPQLPQHIDALFHLDINRFGGKETLQMRVVDIRAAG